MNWQGIEHTLTGTALGVVFLSVLGSFVFVVLRKVLVALWRRFNWPQRVLHVMERTVKPFIIARILTRHYIKKKDYFHFIALSLMTVVDLLVTSLGAVSLIILATVYIIIRGPHFSWALVVLLSLLGFVGWSWFKASFAFYGLMEQTIWKKFQLFRKTFTGMPGPLLQDLISEEDVDVALSGQGKSMKELLGRAADKSDNLPPTPSNPSLKK